jgi:hypothetical protein
VQHSGSKSPKNTKFHYSEIAEAKEKYTHEAKQKIHMYASHVRCLN